MLERQLGSLLDFESFCIWMKLKLTQRLKSTRVKCPEQYQVCVDCEVETVLFLSQRKKLYLTRSLCLSLQDSTLWATAGTSVPWTPSPSMAISTTATPCEKTTMRPWLFGPQVTWGASTWTMSPLKRWSFLRLSITTSGPAGPPKVATPRGTEPCLPRPEWRWTEAGVGAAARTTPSWSTTPRPHPRREEVEEEATPPWSCSCTPTIRRRWRPPSCLRGLTPCSTAIRRPPGAWRGKAALAPRLLPQWRTRAPIHPTITETRFTPACQTWETHPRPLLRHTPPRKRRRTRSSPPLLEARARTRIIKACPSSATPRSPCPTTTSTEASATGASSRPTTKNARRRERRPPTDKCSSSPASERPSLFAQVPTDGYFSSMSSEPASLAPHSARSSC